MHKPTQEELDRAKGLRDDWRDAARHMPGWQASRSYALAANSIAGWLAVAQRDGEVRRPLKTMMAGCAHCKNLMGDGTTE